jgi:hypothetical protein
MKNLKPTETATAAVALLVFASALSPPSYFNTERLIRTFFLSKIVHSFLTCLQ